MILAHARGRFLYEVRPDVFPQGFLTEHEIELWGKYLDWFNSEGNRGKR